MLALVAMRFLVPACRALIVSLPGDHARAVPVKATRAAESPWAPPPTWPPVPRAPPTSRLETFSDAGARTEQYPLQTSAQARLAVKVERNLEPGHSSG